MPSVLQATYRNHSKKHTFPRVRKCNEQNIKGITMVGHNAIKYMQRLEAEMLERVVSFVYDRQMVDIFFKKS